VYFDTSLKTSRRECSVISPRPLSQSQFLADIVVRELKRTKPDAWGSAQSHGVWSTEEKASMRSGHFWICKLGTVPGRMRCVEKKFELQVRKWKIRSTRSPGTTQVLRRIRWQYRQLERTVRRGLPHRGSESSSTRRGDSRRPSYARRGSEKSSGCG
jgi:hypothetical protein